MERRNFLAMSGLLTAFGATVPSSLLALSSSPEEVKKIDPVLLPSLAPLDDKGGMDIRVWVRSGMTNGVFSSVETAVAPKLMGPPPHYHHELDELMYVIEGTASILIGDDMIEVKAGGWHLRPREIKHTFWNASDQKLRFFDMYFNQPFEEYLEEIFHKLTAENGYEEGSEKKNNAIWALNDKFGLVFPEDSFGQRTEIMKQFGLK
ncbi:MAG: cupin domain-containing protein [Bacteroidales bacterium]|nr:cupin domain-containing protein [Bacteroidales bacterium]